MLALIKSACLFGLEAIEVDVEVDVSSGLPGMTIVGLPDKAVEEAKERVRAALHNSGFVLPAKRITVNLAPADIKKEGSGFDLPIALGIIIASGILPKDSLKNTWLIGELALTGDVRHVAGVLPVVVRSAKAKVKTIFVPTLDGIQASLVSGIEVIPVISLRQLVEHLLGNNKIAPQKLAPIKINQSKYEYDFAYVKGQNNAKRALEIAASGGHNLLLIGPPGSGKTLLARCLPSILPPLTNPETLEVSQIYSAAGLLEGAFMNERPFRSPHHTTSSVALVGGGSVPKPGEVTLAHLGVLFLDELPEFPRSAIEALRQPIEDGIVTVSRAHSTLRFPARFTLIAAQNPCPCGYATDPTHQCICTAHQINQYQKKVSGPLLDRIDLHVEVPRISSTELSDEVVSEFSQEIRKRVIFARVAQQKRYRDKSSTNSSLSARKIKTFISLNEDAKKLLKDAIDRLSLSARAYHRVIKVGRTIADLSGSKEILSLHIAEALQYRPTLNQANQINNYSPSR